MLRDVLNPLADETAEMLGTAVASANSALQRCRRRRLQRDRNARAIVSRSAATASGSSGPGSRRRSGNG